MNDEMLRLFAEHEKTDGPPLGLDSEALARKGRKHLRVRRLSAVGGLTAAVAVVAAVAVTLTGLATPSPADEAADGVEQPEYPLPELPEPPEGAEYRWNDVLGTTETSTAATAYGESFRDWFADNGMELAHWPGTAIGSRELFGGNPAESDWDFEGITIPYYGIKSRVDPEDFATMADAGRVGYGEDDTVSLRVHPRGSFEPGAGDTYEYLATCTDDVALGINDGWRDADYTCDETTGPDGELVLRQHAVFEHDHGLWVTVNRVIVFRADGTAVEVDDEVRSDAESSLPLSLDELTDLALSMPDAIVED